MKRGGQSESVLNITFIDFKIDTNNNFSPKKKKNSLVVNGIKD